MGNQILTSYFRTRELESFKIIDESYLEFKPDVYREESFATHGISRERAKRFPDRWESFQSLLKYMNKWKDSLFCCHANGYMFGASGYFDKQVISAVCFERSYELYLWFQKMNFETISTHSIAKKLIPQSDLNVGKPEDWKAYSQENIARYFGFSYKAHEAKSDVEALEKNLLKMVSQKSSREELIELSNYQAKNEDNETKKQFDEFGLPIFNYLME